MINKKILLVSFKQSIGIRLFYEQLHENFQFSGWKVTACGDSTYNGSKCIDFPIGSGGGVLQMFLDTINPINWYKIYKVIQLPFHHVYFAGSHTLNLVLLIMNAITSRYHSISHIHDPVPHSGTWYSGIIVVSQWIQIKLSNLIVVGGHTLKEQVVTEYKVNPDTVYVMQFGIYRKDKAYSNKKHREYFSLLGRIEKYKGIETFCSAIIKADKHLPKDIKFIIGGPGNIRYFSRYIQKVCADRLVILNRELTNEQFDDIIFKSYSLILPYNDGTQSANIQLAYLQSTISVVTRVGSLSENVQEGKTGYIFNAGDSDELSSLFIKIVNDEKTGMLVEMEKNAHNYYRENFVWRQIIKNLIVAIEKGE